MLTFTEAFLVEDATRGIQTAFGKIDVVMDRAAKARVPEGEELDIDKVQAKIDDLLNKLSSITEAEDDLVGPLNTRRDISQTPKHKIDPYFIKRGIVPREDSGNVPGPMLVFSSLYRAIRRGTKVADPAVQKLSNVLFHKSQGLQKRVILALKEIEDNPHLSAQVLLTLAGYLVDKKMELSHVIGHANFNVLSEMIAAALRELGRKIKSKS